MDYEKIIADARAKGGIHDAMLALQAKEGYLTEAAIDALASAFGMFPSQVFETASFYSMIRLQPAEGATEISICRGAPCHVAGAMEVVAALEDALGIKAGNATEDGKFILKYVECQGQCQASPTLIVNGEIMTGMTPESAAELVKGGSRA